MTKQFHTLDDVDVRAKRVLLRVDLNVPMEQGRVTDATRLERVAPTITEIAGKGGKVILLAHFGRPKGGPDEANSLKPVAAAVAHIIKRPVAFAGDSVGKTADDAIAKMKNGDVLLLENTRFHKGEEKNDPAHVDELAKLGDVYVNDAFSAAHRAHATTHGLAHKLPSHAGRAMQKELEALEVLGVDPVKNLVVPRFLALMLVTGLFDIYALLFGIFGGILATIVNHAPLGPFWATFFNNASTTDLWGSVVKTTVFGAIIAIVCCYKGMTASGGAEGVGRAVNQAVVIAFLGVFAFNYAFTQTLLATHPELTTVAR